MIERALQIIAHLLILVLLARNLGPELYGRFAYGLTLVSLFSILGHVGLSGLVVRELVKTPKESTVILGTSFALKFAGFLLGFIALIAFTFASEKTESLQFCLIAILSVSVLFRPFEIFTLWFQAHLQAKFIAISRLASLIVYVFLTVLMITYDAPIYAYALAYVLYVALNSIALWLIYHQQSDHPVQSWQITRPKMKFLFSQGWLIFFGAIFAIISLKIDQVMLKWMVGVKEVGTYVIASNLIEAWALLPNAIVASFFPKLISLREKNRDFFNHRLQQISDIVFVLAIFGIVGVYLFAEPVFLLVLGEQYIGSVSILKIHIWTAIFIFLQSILNRWVIIENALIFHLLSQGGGVLINIALNLLLIPHFQGKGAAIASLISYAISSYLVLILFAKTRPLFFIMSKSLFVLFRYIPYKKIQSS